MESRPVRSSNYSQVTVQRYLLVPPEGIPTNSQLVPIILEPCGAFDLRSSIVADLSKPVPVTDSALAVESRARTDRQVSILRRNFIIGSIIILKLASHLFVSRICAASDAFDLESLI